MDINSTDGNLKRKNFLARALGFCGKNSDLIVKMLVHQFGLTVFGYLLYSAANVSGNGALVIGFGIFSAVFYLVLLYVLTWENGLKDKVRIDSGRVKKDSLKGVKACLAASLPNLIFAVLALIGYLCIDKGVLSAEGAYTSPAWAVNLFGICQIVGAYLNSMYIGIGDYLGILQYPFYLFVIIVPTMVVCGVGYWLGTKNKYGLFSDTRKR